MNAREQLRDEIRAVFGSVPFPAHQGLRAAMAGDDWVSDPAILLQITAEQDIHGEWWEIPPRELEECTLAISYLDAAGVEFYLPAYMTMALDDLVCPKYRDVVGSHDPDSAGADDALRAYFRDRLSRGAYRWVLHFLSPPYADGDDELREHFRDKLSRIDGGKKTVCVKFLQFLRKEFDPNDSVSPFETVNRILKDEFDDVERILKHEFWSS